MRPFSRRARWSMIAAAGFTAMAAGAAPVLLSSGRSSPAAVDVKAGSVDSGAEADLAPGDRATPETTTAPSTTSSAPATTTTTAATVRACPTDRLTMTAATNRTTYRPGDVVAVTVTVTNQSDRPCWVSDRGLSSNLGSCDPQVLLHRYDDADHYNATMGPYFPACGPVRTTLTGGGSESRRVEVPFGLADCNPDPTADGHCARAGTWTVWVSWLTGGVSSADAGLSAVLSFDCPADACAPGPATQTTTSTSTTSTSTTTTTTSTTTSTTSHPSSTTTMTSAPGSSTTTTTR